MKKSRPVARAALCEGLSTWRRYFLPGLPLAAAGFAAAGFGEAFGAAAGFFGGMGWVPFFSWQIILAQFDCLSTMFVGFVLNSPGFDRNTASEWPFCPCFRQNLPSRRGLGKP
jgi:hypothetical protein